MVRRQRENIFHGLVTRIHAFLERLGVEVPNFSLYQKQDVDTYLAFFDAALANLKEEAASIDTVVEEESRELLAIAVRCIFSNLCELDPHIDLQTVTKPIAPEYYERLNSLVRDDVDAYVRCFKRVAADEKEKDEDVTHEAGHALGDDACEA